ncbi:MAG: DUF2461 domain-containing protein [Alphaproteobacteria bacterium]
MAFGGFGKGTLDFLAGLSANNNKAWFDAHRQDYEAHFVGPAVAFVAALAEPLAKLAPRLNAEPRINGSIFRINRDIRFSKDKTPYKDHLDLWFWEGERKTALSGLFFRLTATEMILGTGCHGFDPARLAAFRQAVCDPKRGPAAAKAVAAIERAGFTLGGAHYKTLPRGFAASTPAAERLLKHNAFYAVQTAPHPPGLATPGLVDWCVERWRGTLPIHRWLVENLS